jgi:chromosome segregation ATPase
VAHSGLRLEARGLSRQPPRPAQPNTTVTLDVTELRRTINGLTGSLRTERQRLADKQQELEDALLKIGQLRRDLKYERQRAEDAEAQVARLRAAAFDLMNVEQDKDPSERIVDLIGVDRFALEAERRRHEGGV